MSSGFALRDLACIRAERTLFTGLSLVLAPGDAAVVTGANGAGKSSLLRIAAGLLAPSAGRVERDAGLRVALLSEATALDADQRVAAALGFWARLDGAGHAEVMAALDRLDLTHLAQVPVRLLSTGQRRRVAMARVVASGAALWLLDEPGNGLDARALARLEQAIAAHRAGGGMAIMATHQPIALPEAPVIALGEGA